VNIDLSKLRIRENLSIEKHGDGEVLYSDRDKYCHGANLGYLTEPASNFTEETKRCLVLAPEILEALIELEKGVEGLPPLTAIAGLLTEQCNNAIAVIEEVSGEAWEEIKVILK